MFIDVQHLAKLARIKLTPEETEKFHGELEKVLDHFKELERLDTSHVKPMTGGTELTDVYREDFSRGQADAEVLSKAFPDKKDRLLKVPQIFE